MSANPHLLNFATLLYHGGHKKSNLAITFLANEIKFFYFHSPENTSRSTHILRSQTVLTAIRVNDVPAASALFWESVLCRFFGIWLYEQNSVIVNARDEQCVVTFAHIVVDYDVIIGFNLLNEQLFKVKGC